MSTSSGARSESGRSSSAMSRAAKSATSSTDTHLTVDQLMHHDQWVPDSERHRCLVCTRSFGNFRRKHHCRRCGEVVCNGCLLKKMARLPLKGSLEVKICMNCVLLDAEGPDSSLTMSMRENSTTASSRSSRSQDGHSHAHPSSPSASSHIAHDMDDDDAIMADNSTTSADTLDYSWRYPWPKPPVLVDEEERLEVLRSYDIVGSSPEEKYDIACTLAANSMKCPLAIVSFIDSDRQWFKANVGLAQGEIPRNVSFCAHTIKSSEPLVVWNTMLDLRFVKNPLVTGNAAIRFYAGVPLVAPTGHVIGTVAVFDNQPRQSVDISTLEKLATVVMKYLEERRNSSAQAFVPEPPAAVAAPAAQASQPRRLSQLRRPSDATPPAPALPHASVAAPAQTSQALVAAPAPGSTVAVAEAAPGANMEVMLMNLLSKTTETQQQLATQQGAMFTTLGQHSEQIDKLADAVARMEAKLTTTNAV